MNAEGESSHERLVKGRLWATLDEGMSCHRQLCTRLQGDLPYLYTSHTS
jgi:hypothetical protein